MKYVRAAVVDRPKMRTVPAIAARPIMGMLGLASTSMTGADRMLMAALVSENILTALSARSMGDEYTKYPCTLCLGNRGLSALRSMDDSGTSGGITSGADVKALLATGTAATAAVGEAGVAGEVVAAVVEDAGGEAGVMGAVACLRSVAVQSVRLHASLLPRAAVTVALRPLLVAALASVAIIRPCIMFAGCVVAMRLPWLRRDSPTTFPVAATAALLVAAPVSSPLLFLFAACTQTHTGQLSQRASSPPTPPHQLPDSDGCSRRIEAQGQSQRSIYIRALPREKHESGPITTTTNGKRPTSRHTRT